MHVPYYMPVSAPPRQELVLPSEELGQCPALRPSATHRFLDLVFFGAGFFAAGLAGRLAGLDGFLANFALVSGFAFAPVLAWPQVCHRSRNRRCSRDFALAFRLRALFPGHYRRRRTGRRFRPTPAPGRRWRWWRGWRKRLQKFQSLRARTQLPIEQQHEHVVRNFRILGQRGVISNSVISGNGMRCCTCLHLVRKFLIFPATV